MTSPASVAPRVTIVFLRKEVIYRHDPDFYNNTEPRVQLLISLSAFYKIIKLCYL